MNRIDVTVDGNCFKVMVNFITRFTYSSMLLANEEAKKLKQKEFPHYNLNLITVKN